MSLMRRKRLERLEALRCPPENPYFDVAPFFVPVIEAMLDGRPFSWIPAPDVELSEEQEQHCRLRIAEADRTAARLEQDDPGGATRFQADIERKRAANLRALEREQAPREAA